MADAQTGDFPYTGPNDPWSLPNPAQGGQGQKQKGPPGGYGPRSDTGPFTSWPPPYRSARVQAFVPSFADRPYHQWGDPGTFPADPQPWEAPGIMRGVGGSLAQTGSGFVQPIAMMLNRYAGSFLSGYAQGHDELQKQRFEQLKYFAEETKLRQEQELRDYRDLFSAFGGDPTTGTGADLNLTLKGVGKLHDGLYAIASQYDDKYMLAALDSGNMTLAENILKNRDAKARDLRASITSQKKDQEERDKDAPYLAPGVKPQSAAGPPADETAPAPEETPPAGEPVPETSPGGGAPVPPSAEPPAPQSEPPSQAAPADGGYTPSLEPVSQAAPQPQGVQVAEAGMSDAPPSWAGAVAPRGDRIRPAPQPAPFQPTPDTVLPNAKSSGGLPYNQTMAEGDAQKIVNGDMPASARKTYSDNYWTAINARANVIRGDLRRIENDPRLKGMDVIKAIRSVDPDLAKTVKGYGDGAFTPPRGASQTKEPWRTIINLTSKYDPTFTPATFQSRAATFKDFTSGAAGKNLVSIATAYAHLKALRDDLKRQPNFWAGLFGKYRGVGPLVASDDERKAIGALENDTNTAAAEYERALTGGKPTVSGRDEQMNDLDWRWNDISVLNQNVDQKIARLKERMDKQKALFTAGTGRQPGDMLRLFDQFSKSGADRPGSDDLGATAIASPEMASDINGLRALDRESGAAGTGERIHDSSDYFK
jgi:hypothetical protein